MDNGQDTGSKKGKKEDTEHLRDFLSSALPLSRYMAFCKTWQDSAFLTVAWNNWTKFDFPSSILGLILEFHGNSL